ncbi:hypothetical protein BD779DRAFT_1474532 [Infundibulicybe gibba]|nr:hypothetical protein BD779DRAFT_1474532 [Infundibulicybe gibba]
MASPQDAIENQLRARNREISLTALASSFQKLANRPSLTAKPGSALIAMIFSSVANLCVDNIYRLDLMAQEPDSLAINPLDPKWDSVSQSSALTYPCPPPWTPNSQRFPSILKHSEFNLPPHLPFPPLKTSVLIPPPACSVPAPNLAVTDDQNDPSKDIPQDYTCEDPAQALSCHGPSDNDVDPDNDDADHTITQVENQLDEDNQDDQEPIDPDAVGPDAVDPDVIDQDDDPVKSLDPIDPESSPLPPLPPHLSPLSSDRDPEESDDSEKNPVLKKKQSSDSDADDDYTPAASTAGRKRSAPDGGHSPRTSEKRGGTHGGTHSSKRPLVTGTVKARAPPLRNLRPHK